MSSLFPSFQPGEAAVRGTELQSYKLEIILGMKTMKMT